MMKIFTAENGKKLLIVTLGCMVALAVHQKFVAPRLNGKK